MAGILFQQVHPAAQDHDLRHIPGGTVEQLPAILLPQVVNPQRHPENVTVGQVNPEKAFGTVDRVFPGGGQHIKELLPVVRIEEFLDAETPFLHNVCLDGDQAEELGVEADDVHVVVFPGVERDRPEDIVQHRVGIDVVVQELPDMELLVVYERDPEGVRIPGQGDQRFELFRRHRPVVVETLHIAAADVLQVMHEGRAVHALDDQGNGQGFDHVDNGFQDVDALLLLADGEAEELGVQLDHVHIDGAQHAQGGITAAEVVHHDEETAALQIGHGGPDLAFILHVGGLGDLHLDQGRIHTVFFRQGREHRRHVHREDAHPADVQGDRDRLDAAVGQVSEPAENLLPEIGVQVGDDAVFFQHGNEDGRRKEGAVRALPAGQGFAADDPPGLDVDLGLDVEGDLPVLQGGLEIGQELELLDVAFMDVRIVDADVALEVILDLFRGQGGMVELVHRGFIRIQDHGNTEDGEEAAGGGEGIDLMPQGGEQAVDHRLVKGDHEAVVVLPAVAGEAVHLFRDLMDALCEADQELLALYPAVQVLEKLEVLDVDGDHAPRGLRVLHLFLRHGEEGSLGKKIGHHVPQALGGGGGLRLHAFLAAAHIPDVKEIELDGMLRQGILGSADQQGFHLTPVPVQRDITDHAAEDPAGPGARETLFHVCGVHQNAVGFAVLRMDHMGGCIFEQGRVVIVDDGLKELAVCMIPAFKAVVFQVDDHQLVIGGMHQPLGQLFRRGSGDQIGKKRKHDISPCGRNCRLSSVTYRICKEVYKELYHKEITFGNEKSCSLIPFRITSPGSTGSRSSPAGTGRIPSTAEGSGGSRSFS